MPRHAMPGLGLVKVVAEPRRKEPSPAQPAEQVGCATETGGECRDCRSLVGSLRGGMLVV